MSLKHVKIELLVHENDLEKILNIFSVNAFQHAEFVHYGVRISVEGDE